MTLMNSKRDMISSKCLTSSGHLSSICITFLSPTVTGSGRCLRSSGIICVESSEKSRLSLHAKQIDAAWGKLQMEIKDTGDRHARFYHGGKLILATKRSFGSGTIDGRVQYLIRQQMKLNETQFDELLTCVMQRD